jgi:hypothetical protein
MLAFSPTVSLAEITVTIGASPAYPVPNQSVTLKARSVAEKGEFTYAWLVDGVPFAEAVDLDTVSVTAGGQGTEKIVEVTLTDAGGNSIGNDSYVIRSGSVDVVWEGKTYTPPFYRGKPYPNGDSQIVLQAIPHLSEDGVEIPAGNLVYFWEVGGKKVEAISGYGKSSATIRPTAFKTATFVAVTVQTRDGVYAVRGSVEVPILSPRVVIYEDTPLGGLALNRAVPEKFAFVGDEMVFWAAPFFVVSPDAVTYRWTLSGTPFAVSEKSPSTATFRKTGKGAGTFPVGVGVERAGNIYETGTTLFNLSFE